MGEWQVLDLRDILQEWLIASIVCWPRGCELDFSYPFFLFSLYCGEGGITKE